MVYDGRTCAITSQQIFNLLRVQVGDKYPGWLVGVLTHKYIQSLRVSLIVNIPLVLIGSLATVGMNVPSDVYAMFLSDANVALCKSIFVSIYGGTFGIFSIVLIVSLSYVMARTALGMKYIQAVIPGLAALCAFACLIILLEPPREAWTPLYRNFSWTGMAGVLPAVLTAIVSVEIFVYVYKRTENRWLAGVAIDPLLAQALSGVIPFLITMCMFVLVKFILVSCGILNLYKWLYDGVQGVFLDNATTIWSAIRYHLTTQILWFFGIHGQTIVMPVKSVYTQAARLNADLYMLGETPREVVTSVFIDAFSTLGGTGSTWGLIVAIFLQKNKDNMRNLAKLSILPAIFNVNEILIFGLPIFLNPIYIIPFILAPIISNVVAYFAIVDGFVPATNGLVEWTTPIFLSGYLATHSWAGSVLQAVNVAICAVLYYPFVCWDCKCRRSANQHAIQKLSAWSSLPGALSVRLLQRTDEEGRLARMLAHDLKRGILNKELYLLYQPQVDRNNRVTGVEALLRWEHPYFGSIPPMLIIMIAEEDGHIHCLGDWIIDMACKQLREWKNRGLSDGVTMSINISTLQLQERAIVEQTRQTIEAYQLDPRDLEFEVTEAVALDHSVQTQEILDAIHAMGIKIAIDDFGMGHSSLTYIKHFPIDTIKIDRSLSRDIVSDSSSMEIVSTIISLCASLQIKVIVEYVETIEQKNLLNELGEVHCQGYLFSRPVGADAILGMVYSLNGSDHKKI